MSGKHEFVQIVSWCKNNIIPIETKQVEKMVKYLDLVRVTSKKMNLVSSKDIDMLLERHLIDSLNALIGVAIEPDSRCADLGSGAGFPGIPIAIARPDIFIDLIESRRLKSLFLAKVVEELQMSNAKIVHSRWEKQSDVYDVIFARAVYNESDLIKLALPRLKPGGVLIYFEKFMKVKIIRAMN
jgi:16S rRNA (guanine527-N7)-methyltransferase